MATDDFGLEIPLPPDSTKLHEYPKVVRDGLNRVAEILSDGLEAEIGPAVDQAAATAVAAEIGQQDLVLGSDGRLPLIAQTLNHLAVILDAARNETWLGARISDGGPTDWAMHHLTQRLGVLQLNAPGYLFALADANRNLTDLAIRETDGQLADFVIERLKPRILADFQMPDQRIYADTKYVAGTDVYPVKADASRVAGFGSSSMARIDAEFGALFSSKGAAYYAGGKGSEMAEHIAARLGSVPALVTVEGGSIPASGAVAITTSNVPLINAIRPYTGTLAGVPGTFGYRADPASFIFTRTTAGAVTPVPAGTPFIADASSYRDATVLLWMGKNNMHLADGADTAIRLTDASFDWLAPLAKRCLVLGHFVDTNWPAVHGERDRIKKTNDAHRKRYGRLFVDVSAYITGTQVWADTGITPTQADLDQQAIGNKPPSLSFDNGHLSEVADAAITNNLIAPRLTELGWYA